MWNKVPTEPWVEVFNFALTRDERRVLSWSVTNTIRLWDAATGQQLGPDMQHAGPVLGAAFTSDESRILSWSMDGTVRLWKRATGEQIGAAMKHEDAVIGAVLTGDERRILSWTKNGGAHVWDVATGQQIGFTMRPVAGAMLMKDERTIAVWSDGVLRWRDIGWPAGNLLEVVCALQHHRPAATLWGKRDRADLRSGNEACHA
jgi:WD40 repeat protein